MEPREQSQVQPVLDPAIAALTSRRRASSSVSNVATRNASAALAASTRSFPTTKMPTRPKTGGGPTSRTSSPTSSKKTSSKTKSKRTTTKSDSQVSPTSAEPSNSLASTKAPKRTTGLPSATAPSMTGRLRSKSAQTWKRKVQGTSSSWKTSSNPRSSRSACLPAETMRSERRTSRNVCRWPERRSPMTTS